MNEKLTVYGENLCCEGGANRVLTVFETYLEIIEAACDAWQKLIAQPETITSIGMRQWAHVGQAQ